MGDAFSESTAEVIRKGIGENQSLKGVTIYYLLPDGKMVGKAEITIDWEKHELGIEKDGETIRLEEGKSLLEQLTQIYPILIEHMEKTSEVFGVTQREVRYSYRDEIWNNKEELAKVRAVLGTAPGEPIQWSDKGEIIGEGDDEKDRSGGVIEFFIEPRVLPELGLRTQSLRKLKKT
jgi:hypothetical protein